MDDRFTVDAAVAALLPPEEAKRLGGDFVPESTNTRAARDELQRQCDDFNAIWPVGQRVRVTKDDGSSIETKTRSEAQVLSNHTAVIWLVGISGCYLLDRVLPLIGRAR